MATIKPLKSAAQPIRTIPGWAQLDWYSDKMEKGDSVLPFNHTGQPESPIMHPAWGMTPAEVFGISSRMAFAVYRQIALTPHPEYPDWCELSDDMILRPMDVITIMGKSPYASADGLAYHGILSRGYVHCSDSGYGDGHSKAGSIRKSLGDEIKPRFWRHIDNAIFPEALPARKIPRLPPNTEFCKPLPLP